MIDIEDIVGEIAYHILESYGIFLSDYDAVEVSNEELLKKFLIKELTCEKVEDNKDDIKR